MLKDVINNGNKLDEIKGFEFKIILIINPCFPSGNAQAIYVLFACSTKES